MKSRKFIDRNNTKLADSFGFIVILSILTRLFTFSVQSFAQTADLESPGIKDNLNLESYDLTLLKNRLP
jgi:hypothetical protein